MRRYQALIQLFLPLLVLLPVAAHAHGQPAQLAFWGGFQRSVARCQRVISAAAARCVREATAARQGCYTPSLDGQPCDVSALNAQVAAIRQRALDMIPPHCSSTDLQQLIYADLSDAFRDVVNVCRRLDTALTSAVYGPALAGGSVPGPVEPAQQACIVPTAAAVVKLFAAGVTARQRALDRIAAGRLDPGEKQTLVDQSHQRMLRAAERLQGTLAAPCPDAQFQLTYGRGSAAFLENITRQVDCLAQFVYVQDTVVCPATVCGNGIEEPGEDCDDGNGRDNDGCPNNCRQSAP